MIRFECSCGKRLKVEDRFAGQWVECTACRRRLQAPEATQAAIPVAEVVEEPEAAPAPADDPLAALAKAAKGNGGAKAGAKTAGRLPIAPGAARPAAKVPATADLLARKRTAAPNNKKVLFIAFGVAALAIIGLGVFLVLSAGNSDSAAPAKSGTVYYATQPDEKQPKAKPHPPGEMFPTKEFE